MILILWESRDFAAIDSVKEIVWLEYMIVDYAV